MLFNSIEFLIFFPVVTIIYFLLPHAYRWFHLLVASCIFYMYFVPVYILILFGTIVVDYFAGILIEKQEGRKRKLFLIISLIANIGVLAVFKYYNFFTDNINSVFHAPVLPLLTILLPIGLSFHTFQAMSYTIEVYKGNQKAEKHFGIYALYVMFYPQLVAGPIERPQNVLHQFHEKKVFIYDNAVQGLRLILWGMFKKVVIADNLALFTNPVFDAPETFSSVSILTACIFFSFQIFCDFSGYSDIALGTARVMGYHLMINFNNPYFAKSIPEFWKRWHISLSTWFKDYLYIPLGGNRVPLPRACFNLFLVFIISGLWHGASWTFIIWGALHGFFMVASVLTKNHREKISRKLNFPLTLQNCFNVAFTFFLVTFSWIFFRAKDLKTGVYMITKIAESFKELTGILTGKVSEIHLPLTPSSILLCAALVILLLIVSYLQKRTNLHVHFEKYPIILRWCCYYAIVFGIYKLGVFEEQQFIYFQF